MQGKTARAIRERLGEVAADPFAAQRNVEVVKGTRHGFRLRQADWRITYRVDVDRQVLQVLLVKPRGEVYKR